VVVTRGVSTVVDVSLALLLVSAAAVALVTIPADDPRPPDPDATARSVLASTVTTTYQAASGVQRTRSGRFAALLGEAAVAADRSTNREFVRAVETEVAELLARTDGRVEVIATAGSATVCAGARPPAGASVASVTHDVVVGNESATITVRTWSP
jgi:glucose/arabinose dehydrogenase